MSYFPSSMPAAELESEDFDCKGCGSRLSGEIYCADELEGHLCQACVEPYVNELEEEAKLYARQECEIKQSLPMFDADHQYRCTPEDYEMGNRFSNTPNAHMATCRHLYTNYDELIQFFPKCSGAISDQVHYLAISDRINEMIYNEIDRIQPDVIYEFNDFDGIPF